MQCDRPLAFAKKPLIRIRLVDFTCDHQYYTYYFSYEEDEDDWDNGDGDEGEDYDEEDYKEHSDDYYENHSDDESYDTRPKNRKKDKKNKHEEDPVFNDLYWKHLHVVTKHHCCLYSAYQRLQLLRYCVHVQ